MLILIATTVSTAASTPNTNPNPTGTNPNNQSLNPQDIQQFVDQEISTELNTSGVPGAAITIVKNGETLLAKGYGVRDKETNQPILANQTLFRIASITKLFTWTAIMQLAEQGKLNLDTDINTYLNSFKIPTNYPQPITLKNLMAHNAGFESDEAIGYVPQPNNMLSLGNYLARHMPARIRPPGEISVYSNYGASLAGYIVEQVTGIPFPDYVQTHILTPLGMNHTTLQQPPPTALATELSKSYTFASGTAQPVQLGYYMGTPAAAMFSTATDMALFITAHLQNGEYMDARILQKNTAELMHSQLYTMDPRIPGIAYGFQEYYINGQRIIGHFGTLDAFYSSLMLIPEQGLGWFIVYNGDNSTASPGAFLIAFLNHLFPTEQYVAPKPPADFANRANQYTGIYRNARTQHSTFYKLTSLNVEFEVTSTPSNTLMVRSVEYTEAEPNLFKPYGSSNPWNDTLLFLQDSSGQAYFSNAGGTYEKVPWYETSAFTWTLIAICMAFFVSFPTVSILRITTKRSKSRQKTTASKWSQVSRLVSVAFNLVFISAVISLRFASGNLNVWYTVVTFGLVGSSLALATLPLVALSWKQRYWSLPERLHLTMTVVAAIAFIWFLYNWNLLSFRTL